MPVVLRGACIELGAVYVRWMSHATARCATAASAARAATPQWFVCGFLWAHVHFLHLLIIVFAVVVVLLAIIVVSAPFTIAVVDILISFYLFNVDSN